MSSSVTQNKESARERSLANLRPFKPGKSGNPGGRPKHDKAAEIARAIFDGNPEAVYKAFGKALLKGNPQAFQILADRAFGKMAQRTELTGNEGGAIQAEVKIEFVQTKNINA